MLNRRDAHIWEYIHHLYFEGKTYEDIPLKKHKPMGLVIDEKNADYYKCCFEPLQQYIKDCSILDVGCFIGNKIHWFEKLSAKSYIGIDPDPKCIRVAKIAAKISNMPADVVQTTAEEYNFKADTTVLLSVTHKFSSQNTILDKITSNNFIMETWVDQNNCWSSEKYINYLTKKYDITYQHYYTKNKLVLAGTRLDKSN